MCCRMLVTAQDRLSPSKRTGRAAQGEEARYTVLFNHRGDGKGMKALTETRAPGQNRMEYETEDERVESRDE